MKRVITTQLVAVALAAAGCTTPTPPDVAPRLPERPAVHAMHKASVGEVQLAANVAGLRRCRSLLQLELPGTPESMLRTALTTQLEQAGLYDAGSAHRLNVELQTADFSSGFLGSDGHWRLGLKLSNERQQSLQVETTLVFPTHPVGYLACRCVEQAFAPALQQLMNELSRQPAFDALLG
ncbi:MAG: hypothetical protein EKK52_20655 [Burkholderiales bacterium]|uniref:hypothetical protein n=1 Tax=Roseateles sp. TaxID=1971397 RepID=UPI000FB6E379|nr:MAG: hypothetical protein EKK52_20655 [Burkholderiales bacterium]